MSSSAEPSGGFKTLKSTYKKDLLADEKPATSSEPPLPEGWSAHLAPSGHTYYFHAETKKSTYTRPLATPTVPPVAPTTLPNYGQPQFQPTFAHRMPHDRGSWEAPSRNESGFQQPRDRPRNEPQDRPKHRNVIPGAEPWVLVRTKLGRRFVHNTETGQSLWKFPDHVLKLVIEFDRRRREGKMDEVEQSKQQPEKSSVDAESEHEEEEEEDEAEAEDGDGSSEYTEVEVTDDENEGKDDDVLEARIKRLRTDEFEPTGPVEFNEDDLAFELEEMENYDDEPEEELTEEDCRFLFFDLLDDYKVNPYSTWEKAVEDGQIVEDSRYTALPNMKSRRAAWDDWSREKIQRLKEVQKTQEKLDPRIAYFTLLQDSASTKLYWPEFKRKFKKEDAMKTTKLADKDRERWYRDHVKRLQMPTSQLKSDLKELLKSQPLSILNRDTSMNSLPVSILTDLRFISLSPKLRDPLVETYISTLESDPGHSDLAETDAQNQARKDRQRREKALADRERKVEEQKRLQRKDLHHEKGRLRAEEEQLSKALKVGNRGLKSQLEQDNHNNELITADDDDS